MGVGVDIGSAVAYLDLDLTGFNSALKSAKSALAVFADSASTSVQKFDSIGNVMEKSGKALTRTLSLPLTALGAYSTKAAVEFESAFTGVQKTVDATAEQYELLSDGIKQMATETASSSSEIAGVMEVVGQLGIGVENGTQEIMKFTKTMIMLGDSTNLTAEEAASSLAQFSNIMGTSKSDVDRLGSAVVDLGNKFATTESDIVYMSHRLASAGKIAGLTEQEVLALSTAMSSVGIHAEAGGSAMSQTLKALESAVANYTGQADDALTEIAYVAQVSAQEFKEAWETQPIEAIRLFISGLGSLEERGENATLMLDELGMSGIRQSNMLKALALSSNELARAVDVSNTAWDENVALSEEAEKRYATTESRLKQLKERFNNVAIEIGEILIPFLEKLLGVIEKLVDWWNSLNDGQQKAIVTIGLVVAAIGPLVSILGNVLQIVSTLKSLGGIAGIFGGAKALSTAATATSYFRASSVVLGDVASSATAATTATSVFGKVFGSAGSALKGFGSAAATTAVALASFDVVKNPIIKAIGMITGETEKSAKMLERYGYAGDTLRIVGDTVDTLKRKFQGLPTAWTGAQYSAQALGEAIENINKGMIYSDEQMEKIRQTWQMSEEDMETLRQAMIDANPEIIEVTQNFSSLNDASMETLSQVANGLKAMAESGKTADDVISGEVKSVKNLSQQALAFFNSIKVGTVEIETSVGKVQQTITKESGRLNDFGKNLVRGLSGGIESETTVATSKVKNLASLITKPLENAGTAVQQIGKNFVSGFNTGVEKNQSSAQKTVDNWMNSVKNTMQTSLDEHSPSKFSENSAVNLVAGFNNGISDNSETSSDYVNNWLIDLLKSFENLSNSSSLFKVGYNMMMSMLNGIQQGMREMSTWISRQNLNFNNLSQTYRVSGSHANGLDYVPYNGYIARLHEGERVLTKQETKEYDEGNNHTTGDTYIFYDTKDDPYEYARKIRQVKKELEFD